MALTRSVSDEIRRYGLSVRDFFLAGERATLISPLFNVPARLVLGSYCYYEHLPWLLREIVAAAEPEQLGRRMKAIAMRPNYVNLNALMLGYFNGREQVRLVRGLAPGEALSDERVEDHALVIEFWHRVASVYVEGGSYLPAETGYRLPILPAPDVQALVDGLHREDPEQQRSVRRMTAVTELYTFILNGEARVGVFHHGPYPLDDGETLVVKELVGLRDDFLPWELETRPPVDAIARAMRLRGVEAKIDLFGSLVATPFEYDEKIVAEGLLAREGDRLRELSADEITGLAGAAGDAQVQMYQQAASWPADYQIAYGADLYAALALSFARLAGLDLDERVKEAFHATAERVVPRLLSGDEAPLILQALGAREGDLYCPTVPEPA